MEPLRVLLADGHPVVRGGLRALLGTLDGFEVVGEAADGEAAVRETRRIRRATPTTAVRPGPAARPCGRRGSVAGRLGAHPRTARTSLRVTSGA